METYGAQNATAMATLSATSKVIQLSAIFAGAVGSGRVIGVVAPAHGEILVCHPALPNRHVNERLHETDLNEPTACTGID